MSEDRIAGRRRPRKEGQGLAEAVRRGNRMNPGPGPQKRRNTPKSDGKTTYPCTSAAANRLSNCGTCLSWGHDGAFPLRTYLRSAAGKLFRPRRTDTGHLAEADQAEPEAGDPARPRSGQAR